ncbi:MAG: hypothetical protein K8S18_15685 [Desulfobacula sp.]|nr:hypothetical protein [Desulfobacula sp.]
MKITHTHKINFFDIDRDQTLKVQTMARLFQEMAILHSIKVGVGPDVLYKNGLVWLLYRLEIEFVRYPLLGENLKILTWSRGSQHRMNFRDYRIKSENRAVAKATSVWVFFDFKKKRIIKVPQDIESVYRSDSEKVFETELTNWNNCGKINPKEEISVSLRYGDFDINRHVNNTIYLELLETLFHRTLAPKKKRIRNLKIRFGKEIREQTEAVRVGWKKTNNIYQFNICDQDNPNRVYADGEFIPMSHS